jgi:uncharacterized membrane protein YsdA (DUF1294 family)/cold shock CspA family protein
MQFMTRELSGLIKQWNDEKGFGFIKSDNAADVFFHISALRGDCRPQVGDKVFYLQKKDAQGRLVAEHVRHSELTVDDPNIRERSSVNHSNNANRAGSQIQNLWMKLVLFCALLILPALGVTELFMKQNQPWILGLYVIASIITFVLYWVDKKKAGNNSRRIPEARLHFFESLGGWAGALPAQQIFRHKTSKMSYRVVFWLIVAAHQVFWFDWVVLQGKWLKYCVQLVV